MNVPFGVAIVRFPTVITIKIGLANRPSLN